jgi:hypothetical protein
VDWLVVIAGTSSNSGITERSYEIVFYAIYKCIMYLRQTGRHLIQISQLHPISSLPLERE